MWKPASSRLLISALLLCLAARPGGAQSWDWLDPFSDPKPRQSQPEAARPAPERDDAPAPPLIDQKSQAVERGELTPVMAPDGSGLPFELWRGLDVATLEELIAEIEIPPRSPALHALWLRLITSNVTPPDGGEADQQFLALRLETLYRSGLLQRSLARARQDAGRQCPRRHAGGPQRDRARPEGAGLRHGAQRRPARRRLPQAPARRRPRSSPATAPPSPAMRQGPGSPPRWCARRMRVRPPACRRSTRSRSARRRRSRPTCRSRCSTIASSQRRGGTIEPAHLLQARGPVAARGACSRSRHGAVPQAARRRDGCADERHHAGGARCRLSRARDRRSRRHRRARHERAARGAVPRRRGGAHALEEGAAHTLVPRRGAPLRPLPDRLAHGRAGVRKRRARARDRLVRGDGRGGRAGGRRLSARAQLGDVRLRRRRPRQRQPQPLAGADRHRRQRARRPTATRV